MTGVRVVRGGLMGVPLVMIGEEEGGGARLMMAAG